MFATGRWLFASKLFVAAMIGFSISVHLGFGQNYWPMVTCCVLANPLTGGLRARATYRFAGTVAAGIVALILAGMFGNMPLLVVIVVGLVVTAAFAAAIADRTPRAYGFQLFGMTLCLVLISSVDHPENLFTVAVSRVTQILLGIICIVVVDSLMPASIDPIVRKRLHGWIPDMRRWIEDVWAGRNDDVRRPRDRLKIIADLTSFSALAGQLRYDPHVEDRMRGMMFAVQRHLLRLVPLLSEIEARSDGLADADRARLLSTMTGSPAADQAGADPSSADPWEAFVQRDLAETAREAATLWSEVLQLEAALDYDIILPPALEQSIRDPQPLPLRPDMYLVHRIALGTALAYTIICGLWWATGWVQGPGMLVFGVVALGFFGALDTADAAVIGFARFTLLAMCTALLLCFVLLPMANDFVSLTIVLALVVLPLAAWAASNPMALLLTAITLSNISLGTSYNPPDFGAFLDTFSGLLMGIFIGFYSLQLVRRFGAESAVARFLALTRADIVRLTRGTPPADRDAFLERELDRIGQILSREAPAAGLDDSTPLLARLRAGMNIADLRLASAQASDLGVRQIERLFSTIRSEIASPAPSSHLLAALDDTLSAFWWQESAPPVDALRSLIGLRLALFDRAPAWKPA